MFDNCLTNRLVLNGPRKILIPARMKEENINVRDFLRNYKKLISQNKILVIHKNGKPEGVLVPYPEWEKKEKRKNINKNRKFTIEELEMFAVPGGDPNLSKKVDEICYPQANKLKK